MGDREGDRGLEICVCIYPLSEREREREQKWKVSSVAKRDLRRLMQVADIQRLLINGLLIIQTISSRLIPWLWLAFFIFFFLVFFLLLIGSFTLYAFTATFQDRVSELRPIIIIIIIITFFFFFFFFYIYSSYSLVLNDESLLDEHPHPSGMYQK